MPFGVQGGFSCPQKRPAGLQSPAGRGWLICGKKKDVWRPPKRERVQMAEKRQGSPGGMQQVGRGQKARRLLQLRLQQQHSAAATPQPPPKGPVGPSRCQTAAECLMYGQDPYGIKGARVRTVGCVFQTVSAAARRPFPAQRPPQGSAPAEWQCPAAPSQNWP